MEAPTDTRSPSLAPATGMVVETADGRVTLPGKLYHDEPIVLLTKAGADG